MDEQLIERIDINMVIGMKSETRFSSTMNLGNVVIRALDSLSGILTPHEQAK